MERTPDTSSLALDEAYHRWRPMLFQALSTLAKQGYPAPPSEALDLIHDFFAEAWVGIASNFDPRKGRIESYVYGAFLQFARPRVVKLLRFQRSILEPEALARVINRQRSDSQPGVEIGILRAALDQLPVPARDLLRDYLQGVAPSERALATKYGVSRFKAKELLMDALGHVVVALGRPEHLAQEDWKVACALWRDRRTPEETASYLGLSGDQVRDATVRISRFLATVVETYHTLDRMPRREPS